MTKEIAGLMVGVVVVAAGSALAVLSFTDEGTEQPAQLKFSKRFVLGVDNAFFPLDPGDTWTLEGKEPQGKTTEVSVTEVITVTGRYKSIQGIDATVVKDVVRVDGKIAERTFDWYAQDIAGNVWYFGEDTVSFEDGKASPAGSWEHGKDGAQAGIIMPADPEVTDSGWQENYPGEAESIFWVLDDEVAKIVRAGRYKGSVRVLEWSPLEPGNITEKHYAPGIGLISEEEIVGGSEHLELVNHR